MATKKRARKRTPRKKKPLAGRMASVAVSRNGAAIQIDNVAANDAGRVLGELLTTFDTLTRSHPELIISLDSVGAGSPCDVPDEDYGSRAKAPKRVGF